MSNDNLSGIKKTSINSQNVNDQKITRDELRTLMKAMDKDGFENIMNDYVKEISNPDNVEEMNQYLQNAEKTNDLPHNVKLIKPEVGFCIRTEKYSIKRPGVRQKAFVNICSYAKVQPPIEDKSHRGMWSLPFLLNKGRNDQDKKANICITFDVVFNPEAIKMAKENMAFKKFVIDTSINGVNNNLLKASHEKLSNDFIIKEKYEYKGKTVAYINAHSLEKGELDSRLEPNENYKTNIQKDIDNIKKQNSNTNEEETDQTLFDKPDVDYDQSQKDIKSLQNLQNNKLENTYPIAPKYIIKYSDDFQLHKFFYTPNSNVEGPHYNKLIVEIEVPLMDNLNYAQLELDTRSLIFKFKEIYYLNINFTVDVDKDHSDAKYDRGKNLLTIGAMIKRKNNEKLILKEDENIEIVKDDVEIDKNEQTNQSLETKKEEVNHIESDLSFKQHKNEVEPNTNAEMKLESKNLNSPTIIKETNQIFDQGTNKSEFITKEIKREKLEISNNDQDQNVNEFPPDEDMLKNKKPLIEEFASKCNDEDDIASIDNKINHINQIQDSESLKKISFLNYHCGLIYEID